jgi:hypothetical protein
MSVVSEDEDVVMDIAIVPTPGVFWVPSLSKSSLWQYIVVNKERQRMDGPIQDEDVVRPVNCKYTVKCVDKPYKWKRVSSMRCPTYGNCSSCARSGPAGMACGFCNERIAGYICLYINRKAGRQWIDAQWLSTKLFREGHVTAMANRIVGWLHTPDTCLNARLIAEWALKFYPRADGVSNEERVTRCTDYVLSLWTEINDGYSPGEEWWNEDVDEDE